MLVPISLLALITPNEPVEVDEPLILFDAKFNKPVDALGSIATIGVSCDVPM